MMRAWAVRHPGDRPRLRAVEREVPVPAADELLVRVLACGVCRTDLHLADGDLPAKSALRTPGHEVVGEVVEVGRGVQDVALGDLVGVAWLRYTCGGCRRCAAGQENLCPHSRYTGWDADGGFAEFATVPVGWAYRLPSSADPVLTAPLLCSGIIGYRALKRARVPAAGRLGLYGFGASAHLALQVAVAMGIEVHVLTREESGRDLALQLGAASVGPAYGAPPVALDAAILFAPVGDLVPVALAALDDAGTLAIAGIHVTNVPVLNYQAHLFRERTVTTVTANTRQDGDEFLLLAARLGVRPQISTYDFDAVNDALDDVAAGRLRGAAVQLAPARRNR